MSEAADQVETQARPRVLCVDDEPNILSALRRQLRREYDVTTADTPDHALELVTNESFQIIVSDERMPGMSGHEFLREARRIAPDSVRILLTGQADPQAVAAAINGSGIFRYLQKPWSEQDLKDALEAGVARHKEVVKTRAEKKRTEEQNLRFAEYNRKLAKSASKVEAELGQVAKTLQETAYAAVKAMARLVEWSNPTQAGHGHRVAHLAVAMAERMGLPAEEIVPIQWAAELHDIGKMLTGESKSADPKIQFEYAALGAQLIDSIPGLEETSANIRHHAERFDGRGHPDGLSGTAIPVGARLIAIADAFDVRMHPGPHHKAPPKTEALETVRKQALRLFDPNLVSVLIEELNDNHYQPSADEVTVDVLDLKPGMVLARTLRTRNGKIVASSGHVIQESDLERIARLAKRANIPSRITLQRPTDTQVAA